MKTTHIGYPKRPPGKILEEARSRKEQSNKPKCDLVGPKL